MEVSLILQGQLEGVVSVVKVEVVVEGVVMLRGPPHMIRPAVLDIQLHPVKKLLFIKFTDQLIRDDIVGSFRHCCVSMERVRVLGTSPETDEAEIRLVLANMVRLLMLRKV